MYCPSCGEKIPSHAKFCPICGINIKEFLDEQLGREKENSNNEEYISREEIDYLENLFIEKDRTTGFSQGMEEDSNKEINIESNDEIDREIDIEESEENNNIKDEISQIGNSLKNISKNIKKNKYFNNIFKYIKLIGLKINKLQQIIYNNFNLKYGKYFENNKFTNIIMIFMSFILFVPVYNMLKNSEIMDSLFLKFTILIIAMIGTVIYQLIIISGPFISLKVEQFNYIEKLDKLTTRSIVLTVSFIIAVVNFLTFLLTNSFSSMEFIFFGKINFRIIVLTIIIIVLETLLIQSLVLNKFKKENHFKLFSTIFLSLIAIEIFDYLIARPLVFILLELF